MATTVIHVFAVYIYIRAQAWAHCVYIYIYTCMCVYVKIDARIDATQRQMRINARSQSRSNLAAERLGCAAPRSLSDVRDAMEFKRCAAHNATEIKKGAEGEGARGSRRQQYNQGHEAGHLGCPPQGSRAERMHWHIGWQMCNHVSYNHGEKASSETARCNDLLVGRPR